MSSGSDGRPSRPTQRRPQTRKAIHAGGAYHGEPAPLATFIEDQCLRLSPAPPDLTTPIVGLVAPHMDLWRAARGYGHAYSVLREGLSERATTFFLLGTCHAGMDSPFAVSRQSFATPFGPLEPNRAVIDALARESLFDVFADEASHDQEHSIEFQAVFLRHLLGEERSRAARIVPILCGLGRSQGRRQNPALDGETESFLGALENQLVLLGGTAVVIAGADLAHVGPTFGDPRALGEKARAELEKTDLESIDLARDRDAHGFFKHTTRDLFTRRVCGVGPIYTLGRALSAMSAGRGVMHHYTQHVDPAEGSIVSHTSLSFSALPTS